MEPNDLIPIHIGIALAVLGMLIFGGGHLIGWW